MTINAKGLWRTVRSLAALLAVAVLLTAVGQRASAADIAAVTINSTSTAQDLGNPPFTLGWQFEATGNITVTQLGVYDSTTEGLLDSHKVGIWDSTGTLLGSATVGSGTTGTLSGGFRYVTLSTGINLTSGKNYNIGALYVDGKDAVVFPGGANGFSTASDVSFTKSAFAGGSSLSNPTSSAGNAPAYFGPNFMYTATAPEPASLTLLGIGALGALGYAWRRHKKVVPVIAS